MGSFGKNLSNEPRLTCPEESCVEIFIILNIIYE